MYIGKVNNGLPEIYRSRNSLTIKYFKQKQLETMKKEIIFNLIVILNFGVAISIVDSESISWIYYTLNVMYSSIFIMILGMAKLATATIPIFKKKHKEKEYKVEVLTAFVLFIISFIIVNIYIIQEVKENQNVSTKPLVVMRFGVFILSKISKVNKSENLLIYIIQKEV